MKDKNRITDIDDFRNREHEASENISDLLAKDRQVERHKKLRKLLNRWD